MPYVCISHFLNVSLCSYQSSTSTIQSVLTSQVKAMRKYGLWVVWFQKDIPTTEIPIMDIPFLGKKHLQEKCNLSNNKTNKVH